MKTTALHSWLSLVLLVLTIPAVVQAQFLYTTNNGAITITGYTGYGGAVTIPDTINGYQVTSIGDSAFYSCTQLASVTIGTNVTSIGSYAFEYCYSLTSITIPNSVTSIGVQAFEGCASLTVISVDTNNPSYSSVRGVLFNNIQTTLVQYPPRKAETSYTIPNSVTSIGDSAFSDCDSLTSITIPNSVTNIGDSAFYRCTGLNSSTIGNSVTSIGDSAFYLCTGLTSITIGNSVISIGDSAFWDCDSLTSFTIPNSVSNIGHYAFLGCSKLTSITIPNSVTSIGFSPFWNCSGLTNITMDVTSTGNWALSNCTQLASVTIGTNVTNIGDSAFSGCTRLTCITIPNSVSSIGSSAFRYCTSLTSITIGNSVTSIGSSAFYQCTGLTSITIGNSVTNVGDSAFYQCTGLTSITIGNSVTSIGDSAFSQCTRLTSITIGNCVTSIGSSAFRYCTSLTSITIPSSVTSIGDSAFSGCTKLKSVYCQGNAPGLGGWNLFTFSGCANNMTVYYFPGATGWASTFGGRPTECLRYPLFIIVQPQSQTNNAGAAVTLLVTAIGSAQISYQWQKNGTDLVDGGSVSGATNSTLTITSISDSDAASYCVVLTNLYGSVTTSNAVLTVITQPGITAQPTNVLVLPGVNATFGVSLSGTAPFRYQWRFNGTNLLNATNALYSILLIGTNNAGNYSVVITNAVGSATSSNAALTVVLSPKSQTNYAGSTAMFTATTYGPESMNYQWQKNGTTLVEDGRLSGTTNSTVTIASVSDADAASYSAVVSDSTGSVTTFNAVLTVNNHISIASQPQSQTIGLGSNVTFSVTVYGASPFVFQWYCKGAPVGSPGTGTNASSYSLTNVGTNRSGNYNVLVVNDYGSVTSSNALLTVKVFPPSIGLQPASQKVMIGSSALFTVSMNGTPRFNYQWRFNGADLPSATNAAYVIQAVGATDTGSYSVVVTNLAGSVTSFDALLTVIVPPMLALQLLAGYPVLNLEGMLNNSFVVQYSTNLLETNWINLLSLTNLQSSPYLFLDSGGVGQPARFYRAFMQ